MKNKDFYKELIFTTSRSSGPGGQSVNKVNTKVTLRFDVANSETLNDAEKETVLDKLAIKITREGVLILSAQDNRSQMMNKEAVLLKFNRLLEKAFVKKKRRKATKPSYAAVKKRLNEKKMHSEKKKWRQNL